MLTLTFLGVGSAFAKRNFQSNALIEAWSNGPSTQPEPDDTLLIDFGSTGPLALHSLKSKPEFAYLDRGGRNYYPAIRRVFITHLHGDHIGGLEELAVMNRYYFTDRATGRRRNFRGDPDRFIMTDRYEFIVFPTDHIQIHRKYDWPSFGLLIRDTLGKGSVLYSGDTRFDPDGLGALLAEAKTIFHDVQLEVHSNPVHALLNELRTLPQEVRRKTVLYHYGDTWDDPAYRLVNTEFGGFAKPQHRYLLFG